MNWGQIVRRHSELLLVLAVLVVVSGVFHWIPYKLAFLSFFYLPVLGAGYLFGQRRAVMTGVLCVLVVTIYYFWAWTKEALASQEGFEALAAIMGNNTNILLNVALWGGFLILTGAIIGRVQEKLAASYERSQALNQQLQQRAAELQKLNEALQESSTELRQQAEELRGKDLFIEKLQEQAEETQRPQTQPNRRRSDRVLLVVPVEATWVGKDGKRVTESAETEIVNAHGALLRMSAQPPLRTHLVLTHRMAHKSSPARVVSIYPVQEDGKYRIAVELDEPSSTFWGVSMPTPAQVS